MKIRGTRNDDRLKGGNDPDVIRGLRGDDTITGRGGNDVLFGGSGDDQLNGGAGSDRLYGDAGADRLIDRSNGSDTLNGGADNDYLEFTRRSTTSNAAVLLHGDDGDDHLVYDGAGAANVTATLSGDAGDDVIETSGSATVYGGEGHDTVTLQRHAEVTVVDVGDGDDSVTLQNYLSRSNEISLGVGNDTFDANQCTFDVSGGDGNDTFSTLNARGSTVVGGTGNDVVRANNTEESGLTIDAGDGEDFVSINTTSYEGATHTVTLGEGRDTLELRADNFSYDANVTVTDFDTGRGGDKLRLSDYLAATADGFDGTDPFASGFLRLEQTKAGAVLQIDNDGGGDEWRTIALFENTRASAFREANFVDGYDPALMAGSPTFHHAHAFELTPDSATP